jgi:hypothetical protein
VLSASFIAIARRQNVQSKLLVCTQ